MRRHIVLNALILLSILGCGDARESGVTTTARNYGLAEGSAAKTEAPASPAAEGLLNRPA